MNQAKSNHTFRMMENTADTMYPLDRESVAINRASLLTYMGIFHLTFGDVITLPKCGKLFPRR